MTANRKSAANQNTVAPTVLWAKTSELNAVKADVTLIMADIAAIKAMLTVAATPTTPAAPAAPIVETVATPAPVEAPVEVPVVRYPTKAERIASAKAAAMAAFNDEVAEIIDQELVGATNGAPFVASKGHHFPTAEEKATTQPVSEEMLTEAVFTDMVTDALTEALSLEAPVLTGQVTAGTFNTEKLDAIFDKFQMGTPEELAAEFDKFSATTVSDLTAAREARNAENVKAAFANGRKAATKVEEAKATKTGWFRKAPKATVTVKVEAPKVEAPKVEAPKHAAPKATKAPKTQGRVLRVINRTGSAVMNAASTVIGLAFKTSLGVLVLAGMALATLAVAGWALSSVLAVPAAYAAVVALIV